MATDIAACVRVVTPRLQPGLQSVMKTVWSPCGTMLAVACCNPGSNSDGIVQVLRASNYDCLCELPGKDALEFRHVVWSPCSKLIAIVGSFTSNVCVWCAITGTCVCVLNEYSNNLTSMAWSPCGTMLATGAYNNTARVWRASTGECLKVLRGHTDWVMSVAWSPCGSMLATGSVDRTARLWRFDISKNGTSKDDQCLQVLQGHTSYVTSVAWSPVLADGSVMLATGSHDCTARVWRISDDTSKTGQCLQVLKGHTDWVVGVAWSPCGQHVLTDSSDATARVWRVSDGECLHTLYEHLRSPHVQSVWSQAVLPRHDNNSSVLITASKLFFRVHSFQPSAGRQRVFVWSNLAWSLVGAAWSPCGRKVATRSSNGGLCIWTVCEWFPNTASAFPPAARELVTRIMCARQRMAASASYACVLPWEIWLYVFEFIFEQVE